MERKQEDHFAEIREEIMQIREMSHAGGAITAAHKALISAAIFTTLRCDPCGKAYIAIAHQLGTTLEEVLEVFSLVINAQGCVGDFAAARAVEFYKKMESGEITMEQVLEDLCDTVNPDRVLALVGAIKG